jgi:hypothetical protein
LNRGVTPACLGHIRSADSDSKKNASRVSSFNVKNISFDSRSLNVKKFDFTHAVNPAVNMNIYT